VSPPPTTKKMKGMKTTDHTVPVRTTILQHLFQYKYTSHLIDKGARIQPTHTPEQTFVSQSTISRMKQSLLLSLMLSQLCYSSAFIAGTRSFAMQKSESSQIKGQVSETRLSMSPDVEQFSRRQAMKQAASLFLFSTAVTMSNSSPAEAKKEEVPVTREGITAAFQAVRYQLESPNGGVKELQALVEKEDFEAIMIFTRDYDLEFRKAKMGKARKLLTSKEEKDRGVLVCNAVTFDLIGMNKSSRPGQQDIKQVQKYFGEMETDISTFLEMEKGIDFSVYDL